jgi:hypothetical protein
VRSRARWGGNGNPLLRGHEPAARLFNSAGQAMVGDSHLAMQDLVNVAKDEERVPASITEAGRAERARDVGFGLQDHHASCPVQPAAANGDLRERLRPDSHRSVQA